MTSPAAFARRTAPRPRHCLVVATALDDAIAGDTLTPEESWISSVLQPAERRSYRAGRLAARRALSALERNQQGTAPLHEPVLAVAENDGRAVAVAVPGPARLGVGLERGRSIDSAEVRPYFSPLEAMAGAHDAAVQSALKQAAWRALQRHGTPRLEEIELCVSDAGRLLGARLAGVQVPASGAVALPWAGWVAAAVWLEGS